MELKWEGQEWENAGIIARVMNAHSVFDEERQCFAEKDERRVWQELGTN